MADTGVFCTTAEVRRKAGTGASTLSTTEAYVNDFVTQAESLINTVCRYNFTDNYPTLNVDVRGVLKLAASNIAAIYVVTFDMSGYSSRIEAEDLINILRDGALQALSLLRDKKQQEFVKTS